jgi:hypothetical protein
LQPANEGRGAGQRGTDAEKIFESLRPAQDIHPGTWEGAGMEDKEPEKVDKESGAHETEVN